MNCVLTSLSFFLSREKKRRRFGLLHKWLTRESMSSGNGVVMSNNIMECSLDH